MHPPFLYWLPNCMLFYCQKSELPLQISSQPADEKSSDFISAYIPCVFNIMRHSFYNINQLHAASQKSPCLSWKPISNACAIMFAYISNSNRIRGWTDIQNFLQSPKKENTCFLHLLISIYLYTATWETFLHTHVHKWIYEVVVHFWAHRINKYCYNGMLHHNPTDTFMIS
jgi:hypothetical protein